LNLRQRIHTTRNNEQYKHPTVSPTPAGRKTGITTTART